MTLGEPSILTIRFIQTVRFSLIGLLSVTAFLAAPPARALPGEAAFQTGARLYDNGTTQEEWKEAITHLIDAAKRRHMWAIYYLSKAYEEGKGVEKDIAKSYDLARQAARLGNAVAAAKACKMAYYGRGTEKDVDLAIYYCTDAAVSGWPAGQRRLASIYLLEKKDLLQAAKWFNEAATPRWIESKNPDTPPRLFKGDPEAQYQLAKIYLHYKEFYDPKLAFQFFGHAANQGHRPAQLALAALYREGVGTDRNLPAAWKWLTIAAKGGGGEAEKAREHMAEIRGGLSAAQIAAAQEEADSWSPPDGL